MAKADALAQCRAHYGQVVLKAMCELSEHIINGWRDELESASPERCQRLQGKIQGVREFLEMMKPQQHAEE